MELPLDYTTLRLIWWGLLGEQQIGFGVHLLPVYFAKAIHKLATEKNILGDSELRDQVQLLVDDTDSGFLGGFRAVKGGLFPQPQ